MNDSNPFAETLQAHDAFPRLCPDQLTTANYTFCKWAKTVTGWDVNLEAWLCVAVTCKRWGCPYCAEKKVSRLAWMTSNASPNKLATFTVSAYRYPDGKSAWDHSSKMFPEWIRWTRQANGPCDYLRVLELQANGMPHYHCLLRSNFIPHNTALAEWRRLIGFPDAPPDVPEPPKAYAGVNLKKIDKSFATFRYLVKYLTKLHKIPWTDRHVSYSKDFFMPEDKEQVEYAKLDQIEKSPDHPWKWLNERYGWNTVGVHGEGKWVLPDRPHDPETEIDPASLGLPADKPDEPEPTIAQRLIPGLQEPDLANELDHLRPDGSKRRTTRRPTLTSAPAEYTPVPF